MHGPNLLWSEILVMLAFIGQSGDEAQQCHGYRKRERFHRVHLLEMESSRAPHGWSIVHGSRLRLSGEN
jgi:hypothetical protein